MGNKPSVEVKECNRNAKRTRRLIGDAFFDLMEEKQCFKITVRELSEKADINRSTFYLHYLDIPDLIDKLEEHICQEVVAAIETITRQNYVMGKHPFHILVFQALKDNERQCRILLGENGDINFFRKLTQAMEVTMYKGWAESFKGHVPEELDMYVAYVVNGIIGLFLQNLRLDCKWSAEEMGHLAGEVTNWLDEGLIVKEARKR